MELQIRSKKNLEPFFFLLFLLLTLTTSFVWAEDLNCSFLFQLEPSVPMNSHPEWIKDNIYPKLTSIRENYLEDIQKSHGQLEVLLEHRLFKDFSREYITNIEQIITKLMIERGLNSSLKIEIEINYLISILSKINLRYRTSKFNPDQFTNNKDRTAFYLLNSISKLMSSDKLHFSSATPRSIRETFAKTQQKVALMILSKITTFDRSSTFYFMSYDPQFMNLLIEDSGKHYYLALKAIRNLCSGDSDQVSLAISKLVEKKWINHEAHFYNLIKLLHDSVEHNRSIQLDPSFNTQVINDLISKKINAPIRDLEMNMINIIKKTLRNPDVNQYFDKAFVLLNIITEKQIPLSDRNLNLLIDALAESAAHYLSPIQEEKLDQYLLNISKTKKEQSNFYNSYIQLKQEKVSQSEPNLDQDDITYF